MRLRRALAALAAAVACAPVASAHEPVFGLGPNTLWEGGSAIEIEAELELAESFRHGAHGERDPLHRGETEGMLVLELARGLTPDLMVFVEAPLAFARERALGHAESAAGAGDVGFGATWRFWRRQSPARSDAAAVVVALRLPTGRRSAEPPLGWDAGALALGLTGARDAIGGYLWGSLVAEVPIPGRHRAGPALEANVAAGPRLWVPAYRGADLVVLAELGARVEGAEVRRGDADPDSGGAWCRFGPSFLFFWDRFETKAGVRIPLWRRVRGRQASTDVEVVVGVGVVF